MSNASVCSKCQNKVCLKLKRPCDIVEAMLPKAQTGRLKGEGLSSSDLIDRDFAREENGEITSLQGLRKNKAKIYNSNCNLE